MILIQNARLLDPAENTDRTGEIAVVGGQIADPDQVDKGAAEHIDAAGCWVIPGLIDFHCHFFPGGSELGMPVDGACLPSGVTTAVDAGSAGTVNFPAFHRDVLCRSQVRTFALLNLCPTGLQSLRFHENLDPALFDGERMAQTLAENPRQIVGLKMRVSRDVLGELGAAPLDRMMALADKLDLPVVVHTTDPAFPVPEILARLRRGDVFTHAFHGTGDTILEGQRIKPAVIEARRRGVLFDDCHGRAHFSFRVLERALAEGFLPDMLSSDAILQSIYRHPLGGLPMVLSRYLAAGVPVMEILRACICAPARFLGLAELDTLRPGTPADLTILQPLARETTFADAQGQTRRGDTLLVPRMTIRGGRIAYRSFDLF